MMATTTKYWQCCHFISEAGLNKMRWVNIKLNELKCKYLDTAYICGITLKKNWNLKQYIDFNNIQYHDLIIPLAAISRAVSLIFIAIFRLFNHYTNIAEYCLLPRSAPEFSRWSSQRHNSSFSFQIFLCCLMINYFIFTHLWQWWSLYF